VTPISLSNHRNKIISNVVSARALYCIILIYTSYNEVPHESYREPYDVKE
jgi:hypothetical protein